MLASMLVLLSSAPCYAHSVSPSGFAVGPLSFVLLSRWWWALPVAGAIMLEILLLWFLVKQGSLGATAWRAIILYLLTLAVESAVYFSFPSWFFDAGFSQDFAWTTFLLVALGLLSRIPFTKILYTRRNVSWSKAIAAGIVPGLVSYLFLTAVAFALSHWPTLLV
ncbi:MAG: hypothetical protein ABFD92_06520 [Planctomycetaceae bacterium]